MKSLHRILPLASVVVALAVAGCGAEDDPEACHGGKCDDGDDHGAAAGAVRELPLVACWVDATSAKPDRLLRCTVPPRAGVELPLASAQVTATTAGGVALSLTPDVAHPGSQVRVSLGKDPVFPLELELHAELAAEQPALIGLPALGPLTASATVAAAADAPVTAPIRLTLPFDLWPVELDARLDAMVAVAPYALEVEPGAAALDVAPTIALGAGEVRQLLLPVPRDQVAVELAAPAPSGAGGGVATTLELDGPAHVLIDDAGLRRARRSDAPARYCVPPTIMMHSANAAQLRIDLIPWLRDHGYTTITYRDYLAILTGQAPRPPRPVILTIDDVPTSFIRQEFKDMVRDATAADMTVALAVNTIASPESTNSNDQARWQLLRDWQAAGVELDSHGSEHFSLESWARALVGHDRQADGQLRFLIEDSINALDRGTAERPTALITPFGVPEYDDTVPYQAMLPYVRESGARFIVGIPLGRQVDAAEDGDGQIRFIDWPVFVGRVEIQRTVEATAFEIERWYRRTPECLAALP